MKTVYANILGRTMRCEVVQRAKFEPARFEVGTGGPGYRWVDGVYIITPDGKKLFPPMLKRDARAYCKREGWTI